MWLLIGCGSSLHSDDRLGWVVVETIAGAFDPSDVEAIVAVQLFPELAEPISRAEGVIFVDADATLPPGKIGCVNLTPNPSPFHREGSIGRLGESTDMTLVPPLYEVVRGLAGEVFAHHLTPQAVLNAAHVLYGRVPEAWLYSVGGANFELGEALSPAVEKAVPELLRLIWERVETPCTSSASLSN